jgi:5-methyltetrahydropteroyltriglutamate--homocysteine methyltransferase
MRTSTDRILTTHAGSLPRPDALREAWSKPATGPDQERELDRLLQASVKDVV